MGLKRVAVVATDLVEAHGIAHILESAFQEVIVDIYCLPLQAQISSAHLEAIYVYIQSPLDSSLVDFATSYSGCARVLIVSRKRQNRMLVVSAPSGEADAIEIPFNDIRFEDFVTDRHEGNLDPLKLAADRTAKARLSDREAEVCTLISTGLTHQQIARRLGISNHTVDTYVKRAKSKLTLGNKADVTRAILCGARSSSHS